jgi:hypothetical protein
MSAVAEQKRGTVVVLPPNVAPEESVNPSMTRWAWNPYFRINNFGSIGLARQFGAAEGHRYTEFEQGTFYPLKNISWMEPDLEAAAEQSKAGINAGAVPDTKHVKYAYEQAEELASSFGDRGVVVFQPGLFLRDVTWVDDHELVKLVADTVQPHPFKIFEMVTEFGKPAEKRIRESKELEPAGQELASAFRVLMLRGAHLAMKEAEREYELLIQYMGNAATGAAPKIATPNDFHRWICEQLGRPVPSMVNAGIGQQAQGNATLETAVNLLAQKALKEDAFEARLAAVEARGTKQGRAKKVERPA